MAGSLTEDRTIGVAGISDWENGLWSVPGYHTFLTAKPQTEFNFVQRLLRVLCTFAVNNVAKIVQH